MKKINKIVSTFLYIIKITSFVSLYSCGNSVKQPVDLANSFNKNVPKKEPQKSIAAPKQNENTGINSEKLLTLMSCSRSAKDDKTTTTNKKAKNNKKKNKKKSHSEKPHGKKSPKEESPEEKSTKKKSHSEESTKKKSQSEKSPKKESQIEKPQIEKPQSEKSPKEESPKKESPKKESPEEESHDKKSHKNKETSKPIDSLDALQELIKVVKKEKNSNYEINVVWFASGNIQLNGGKAFSVANKKDFSTLLESFKKLKQYKVQINGLDAILSSGETNKINENVFIWKNDYFWKNINKFVELFNIEKKFFIKTCSDSKSGSENKVLIKDFGVCDFTFDDVVDNKGSFLTPRKSPNKKIKSDFEKIFTLEEND